MLAKININSGAFSNLLDYSDIYSELQVPITSCSLSILDDTVFIGYSRIDYDTSMTNKTNMVFKFNIENKDSNDGSNIIDPFEKSVFIFPESFIKTDSSRQIDCEPLRIFNDIDNYRLT